MSFLDLQAMVKEKCNNKDPGLGDLILSDFDLADRHIKWIGSISGVKDWARVRGHRIETEEKFQAWAKETLKVGFQRGGLHLQMEKPVPMAESRKRNASFALTGNLWTGESQQPGDMRGGDHAEIDIIVRDLHKKCVQRRDLDPFYQVYEIPGDTDGYVLMSPGNAQTWAQQIRDPTIHGVSSMSPPSHMRESKRAAILKNKRRRMSYPAMAGPSNSVIDKTPPRGSAPMSDYLKFIDINDPLEANEILDILKPHRIRDYHNFHKTKGSITKQDLLGYGIPGGVISDLLDNVDRFDEHLANKE
ncbi:hypothetical protein DFH28DRAFT_1118506 [Melampsora americana]|nr:hypothetical protein DFH28DRAFT_1118506 [Melampsora americana]